jgi:methyl-accepting chemotaxis protein
MALLKNSKMSVKLCIMILPLFVVLIYILYQFSYQMNMLNHEAKTTYYNTLYINSSLLLNADRDFYAATLAERSLMEGGESLDKSTKERYLNTYNENCSKIMDSISKVDSSLKSNQELYSEFKHSKTQLTMSHLCEQFTQQFKEWQAAYDPNTGSGFIIAKNAMFDGIRDEIKTMTELLDEYSTQTEANMQHYINTMVWKLLALFASALLIVVFLCLYTARFIISGMKGITGNMNALSENDLSFVPHRIVSKDELGVLSRSVITLVDSWRSITSRLIHTSDYLSNSSASMKYATDDVINSVHEISKTIEDIAQGAASQAEDTQKLVDEINSLDEAIQTNTVSTKELSQTASKIITVSQEGLETVNHLDKINLKSQLAFQSIFHTIDIANNNASKIVETSSLIANIAEQINLISLNASIEAARAGDAGKGFAVIAGEIHKLSEQTTSSTSVIDQMLNEIKDNIQFASLQSKEVESIVELQTISIADTKNKYLSIVSFIDLIHKEIDALENVSKKLEQNRRVISEFITDVSAVSEEYAASTEETAAATQQVMSSMAGINVIGSEIDELVIELKSIIDRFSL